MVFVIYIVCSEKIFDFYFKNFRSNHCDADNLLFGSNYNHPIINCFAAIDKFLNYFLLKY